MERPNYRERLAYLREKYNKAFLTVSEAAHELSVCQRTLRDMICNRRLEATCVSENKNKAYSRYVISVEAIAKL